MRSLLPVECVRDTPNGLRERIRQLGRRLNDGLPSIAEFEPRAGEVDEEPGGGRQIDVEAGEVGAEAVPGIPAVPTVLIGEIRVGPRIEIGGRVVDRGRHLAAVGVRFGERRLDDERHQRAGLPPGALDPGILCRLGVGDAPPPNRGERVRARLGRPFAQHGEEPRLLGREQLLRAGARGNAAVGEDGGDEGLGGESGKGGDEGGDGPAELPRGVAQAREVGVGVPADRAARLRLPPLAHGRREGLLAGHVGAEREVRVDRDKAAEHLANASHVDGGAVRKAARDPARRGKSTGLARLGQVHGRIAERRFFPEARLHRPTVHLHVNEPGPGGRVDFEGGV